MSDEQPQNTKPQVVIYSDGGADPNPGPGGWGVVLLAEVSGKTHTKELSGGEAHTTNNRMELTAAIRALRALKGPSQVEFHTDSQYVKRGITEWMENWLRTNFKKGKIENAGLWQQLNAEAGRHEIQWHWVKGHAGNRYNERCDQLATAEIRALKGQAAAQDGDDNSAPMPYRAYFRVSCPGKAGGWAALVVTPEGQQILSGSEKSTSANRLELLATVAALKVLPAGASAQCFTGSSYLHSGLTQWVNGWKKSGWIKKTGGEVLHRELWEQADQLMSARQVAWIQFTDATRPPELEQLDEALQQAVERAKQ